MNADETILVALGSGASGKDAMVVTDRAVYSTLADAIPLPCLFSSGLEMSRYDVPILNVNGQMFDVGPHVAGADVLLKEMGRRIRKCSKVQTDPGWKKLMHDVTSMTFARQAADSIHAGRSAKQVRLAMAQVGMDIWAAGFMASTMAGHRRGNSRMIALGMMVLGAALTVVIAALFFFFFTADRSGAPDRTIHVKIGGIIFGPILFVTGLVRFNKAKPVGEPKDYIDAYQRCLQGQS
jgi:hypothetical protein